MILKRLKKILASFPAWISLIENTYAQTAPGFTYGQIPTTTQWNSYFSNKLDYPTAFSRNNTWTGGQTFNQAVNLGLNGVVTGSANLNGPSSGTINFQAQPNAGTYTWVWPTTIGAQGQVLQTQGTGGIVWGSVPYSQMSGFVKNVNLNSIADTQINLTLPTTNYIIEGVWIENTGTLANLASGSFSLCTLAASGGTCVVPITTQMTNITATGINNNNNGLVSVINSSYWNTSSWFFRVTKAAGAGAVGTVMISTHPLAQGLP